MRSARHEVSGINRNTVARMLTGRERASDRTVAALAAALQCHPAELFVWTPTDRQHAEQQQPQVNSDKDSAP